MAACSDYDGDQAARAVIFEDVAQEAGLDFVHHNGFSGDYYYVETFGAGAAFLDYDGDGWLDAYLVDGAVLTGSDIDPAPSNKLYRNEGGVRFVYVSAEVGAADSGYGMGCAVADYDNDGDQDLFLANFGPDRLYRNEGGSSFSDVTSETGLGDPRWGTSTGFLDCDNDTDIYVANDGTMNFLYENRRGSFVEVGLQVGARYNSAGRAEAGMGVDFGDYDNDGDLDLFVTNFTYETNTLYANDNAGQFLDVTTRAGLNEPSFGPLGFGARFLDYDNDSDLDLFVANGHVMDRIQEVFEDISYRQPNQILGNDGRVFSDHSSRLGPGPGGRRRQSRCRRRRLRQ